MNTLCILREDEFNSWVRLTFVNGCSDLSKSTRVNKTSTSMKSTRVIKYKGNPLETEKTNSLLASIYRLRRGRTRDTEITSSEGQGSFAAYLSGCSIRFTVSTDVREYFLCISNGCKITCFFTRASKTRLVTTLPVHFRFSFIVCFASGLSRG